jgi:hypothetical protein
MLVLPIVALDRSSHENGARMSPEPVNKKPMLISPRFFLVSSMPNSLPPGTAGEPMMKLNLDWIC